MISKLFLHFNIPQNAITTFYLKTIFFVLVQLQEFIIHYLRELKQQV